MKELNFLAAQRNAALDQVVKLSIELSTAQENYNQIVEALKHMYSNSSPSVKKVLLNYFPNVKD